MAFVPIRGLSSLSDIEKAATLAEKAIGRTPGAGIEMPTEALDKLRWLAHDDREFRATSPVMLREMSQAFTSALFAVMRGKAPVTEPWLAAAETYRNRLALRLTSGGGDIKKNLRPLKPETIKRKGHPRIGYDTGDLWRMVSRAKVRTTRGAT